MPNLAKLKKLSHMPAGEIASRAGEVFKAKAERRKFDDEFARVQAENFNFFAENHRTLLQSLQNGGLEETFARTDWRRRFPIPFDGQKAEDFRKKFSGAVNTSIARADDFLAHKFKFMGVEITYPEKIDWLHDPRTNTPFPDGFYRDIKIFKNVNGTDIKHIWEVHRLQFLIEIAKAWYVTGDAKYQQEIDAIVEDWVEANPYKKGVAWTSALEVGVRAFSFLWTLNFYLAAPDPNPKTVNLLLKSLYLAAKFIDENLSIYFSPYNHLIGEVAALFAIGYLFPGFKEGDFWARKAWKILEEQAPKQFHPDGCTVEQATFYHHFTLGFYLQCINLRRINGDAASPKTMGIVEKALEFPLAMTRPDGTLPWVGDIDTARSLYFSDPAQWNFRGFQAFGAAWFQRSDMRWLAGNSSEEAFWNLSQADYKLYENTPSKIPGDKVTRLRDAGYVVMRSGRTKSAHYGMIDCGPIAHGIPEDGASSAAHGHADLLSIEIAPFGENMLIDPGFSNYRGEYNWHKYFRGTAAHNTLEIDEQSQAVQSGILNWSHAPRFRAIQTFSGKLAQGFCGEHYGYHRLANKPTHRRYFAFVDQAFWLTYDLVYPTKSSSSEQTHLLRQHFHFGQNIEVTQPENGQGFSAVGETARLEGRIFYAGAKPEARIKSGGPYPEEGWISPTYRERRPAPVASFAFEEKLPFSCLTLFVPRRKDSTNSAPVFEVDGKTISFSFDEKTYSITHRQPTTYDFKQDAAAELAVIIAKHLDNQALRLRAEPMHNDTFSEQVLMISED